MQAGGVARSKQGWWRSRPYPYCTRNLLREVKTRERHGTPLSLVVPVNAHVLAEIVVATERFITFRERTQKR